jgi:Ran GTPase-activating protein (RanGAP) involved in mRNA processing and transport
MQNVSLKHLTLIGCGIGDRAMIEIAKGISEAICLELVDLRHNHFEKVGYTALIEALKSTMVCKDLLLEGLTFQMEEAELLCTFLEAPGCLL